ncbi:MAG: CBS domain-containing protein [Vicinamibacteria bacterium]
MTSVRQILAGKPAVYSVTPDTKVFDALGLMAEKNVGALLVVDGERLVGIFSERDYARKVVLLGRSSRDTPVREIMSTRVVSVAPSRTAGDCMALMTEARIRHLPVLEAGRIVGVISIGDVVRSVVEEQRYTIEQLESYIQS